MCAMACLALCRVFGNGLAGCRLQSCHTACRLCKDTSTLSPDLALGFVLRPEEPAAGDWGHFIVDDLGNEIDPAEADE